MKLLAHPTTQQHAEECAALVMETVPLLMRAIRHEIRQYQPEELSMPQFRTLRILQRHPELSLSDLAEHLGLTLASASKMVDVLVKHGLVNREASVSDRRKIVLQLNEAGRETLEAVWLATRTRLTAMLSTLEDSDRAAVVQAMRALHGAMDIRKPDSRPTD